MDIEELLNNLKNVGWGDFAPGTFLDIDLDQIGKAKVARDHWFILIKALAVLDNAAITEWNENFSLLLKRSPARGFKRGRFFILLLLVERIAEDTAEKLLPGNLPDILVMADPEYIFTGGGFSLVLNKEQQEIITPNRIRLANWWRATTFINQTLGALAVFAGCPAPTNVYTEKVDLF